MAIPEFITDLREHVGTKELWLPAVRGVVVRRAPDPQVLLVRRSDNGNWTVTAGILDPGEDPAVGAVREIEEETSIIARPVRVAGVFATPMVEYRNGDRCRYLDTVLEMEPVSGEPRVNDDESVDAGWYSADALPEPMSQDQKMVIEWALDSGAPARFRY